MGPGRGLGGCLREKNMANYVISDLHGEYELYLKMLEKIHFSKGDMLYVLGDVLDRGPHPIQIILDLMKRPNVVCLAGNHEYMAIKCLKFLTQEITEESVGALEEDSESMEPMLDWLYNGAEPTINEFAALIPEMRRKVYDYIAEFDLYEEVEAGGQSYLLVHAGLGNFRPDKPIWEYEIHELVWERPDYEKPYFQDKYVVTGHTPTLLIPGNSHPGYIFRKNHHIAIDCGVSCGGRLGCLCLDTGEEFYVE